MWRALALSLLVLAQAPSGAARARDGAADAMRHTDLLLRLVKEGRPQEAATHLDAATSLLHDAVERDPDRAAFALRWRTTVAGLLHAFGSPGLANRVNDAMAWLKTSNAAITADTSFRQGLAAEIRAAVAGPLSGTISKRAVALSSEARGELKTAARNFEDALAADPACAEAALHLGRIRLLTGRDADADAERLLRIAAAGPVVPVRYLGLLFLGTLAERQGRLTDAEAQYRAAFVLFPWGQSASLALSHALMREGREADSRATLTDHFTATRGRVVDPLWSYLGDPATDLGPALDLLRAEVSR
jgi:Tfp pilus assembly protein PilF